MSAPDTRIDRLMEADDAVRRARVALASIERGWGPEDEDAKSLRSCVDDLSEINRRLQGRIAKLDAEDSEGVRW